MENLREFASSTNGDRWFLRHDEVTNTEVVVHRGNSSSGGHETSTALSSFLKHRPFGPEHDALIRILVERSGEGGEVPSTPA